MDRHPKISEASAENTVCSQTCRDNSASARNQAPDSIPAYPAASGSAAMQRYNKQISATAEVYHRFAVKLHMSNAEFDILDVLLRNISSDDPGCSQRDLAIWLGLPRQTVNSACMRMLENELIELRQGRGRRKVIQLTPSGLAFAGRTVGLVQNIEDQIFNSWNASDRVIFLRLNQQYLQDLRACEKNFMPAASRLSEPSETDADFSCPGISSENTQAPPGKKD